jgi:hypothetical protein
MSAGTISQHVSRPPAIRTGGPRPKTPVAKNDQWSNVQWPQRGFETLEPPPIPTQRATIRSMTPADAQQQRLLDRLRQAGHEPVAFAELHADGIAFPAAVVSELELNGYAIERVYDRGRLVGVRLLHPEPQDKPAARRRRRRPWPQR